MNIHSDSPQPMDMHLTETPHAQLINSNFYFM